MMQPKTPAMCCVFSGLTLIGIKQDLL
uniref:Uncharacterized protein n=1 Tax=Arundo donax TaxID=35708 RepID=A0A0A8ZBT5_ARUDO